MSQTLTAGELGPQHIGNRVRLEFPAMAIEASIEQVSHHYRANDDHTVYVALQRGPDDDPFSNRVLSPMPTLTLGAGDLVTLL
jgi:hypothetical protein